MNELVNDLAVDGIETTLISHKPQKMRAPKEKKKPIASFRR